MSVGPHDAPTSWFSFTNSQPEFTSCGEPKLECVWDIVDPTTHKQTVSGGDPVVKLGFLREDTSGENSISSERVKLFRKASAIRYTTRKKDMPSLVQ